MEGGRIEGEGRGERRRRKEREDGGRERKIKRCFD